MVRIILVFISFTLSLSIFGQKQLILLNKDSNQPIPFAAIVSSNYMTVSDNQGGFKLPERVLHQISIQHVAFNTQIFIGKELKSGDTLYLTPTLYKVNEVKVNFNLKEAYCRLLSKALKQYRTHVIKKDTTLYAYYLESIYDDLPVEKIKTLLHTNSGKNRGYYLSGNYLEQGEFWYNPKTPYLNLSTEKLLLSFQALVSQKQSRPWFMPLNSANGIKTKQYGVDIIKAYSDTLTLGIATKDRNKRALVTFNKNNLDIYEVEFTISNLQNHNMFDLNTGKKVGIHDLQIKYFFNAKSEIDLIQFGMRVTNTLGKTIDVRGYFNKNVIDKLPMIKVFAGAYYPDHLYEQIILTGKSSLLDSIFNVNHYKGYDFSDTLGLRSVDSFIIERIKKVERANRNYYSWKTSRLTADAYTLGIVNRYMYDPSLSKIVMDENQLNVFWAFNLNCIDDSCTVSTHPALWYKNNQILYLLDDTLTVDLNANLIFDLYEIQRRDVYDSVKIRTSPAQIASYIQKEYAAFNKKMDNLIVRLSKEEVYYDQFCKLNAVVQQELGMDNLAMWFSQKSMNTDNFNYLKQQYEHVKHAYLRYEKSKTDTLLFHAYTQSMINITKIIISLNKRTGMISTMEQASYYYLLATYYYNIGDYDKVCKYVAVYKDISPVYYSMQNTKVEGVYIGSKVKKYYEKHCGPAR